MIKNLHWLLENHKKFSQISNTLLWRLNTLTNDLTIYCWASSFSRSSKPSSWFDHLWILNSISSRVIKVSIQSSISSYLLIYWNFLELTLYENIINSCLTLRHSMNLWKCYEHAWIDQNSDDAMSSLNLAHLYWTLRVILSTSSHCSALSSFISFIILLGKHIWHITSHLYRV